MASSLSLQLQDLRQQHQIVKRKKKTVDSFFFSTTEASTIDDETIYHLSVNGLYELEKMNTVFRDFLSGILFSRDKIHFHRAQCTAEQVKEIDVELGALLSALAPYFLLKPAQKVLEFLIRKYEIQLWNVDAIMTCILMYHESEYFLKMVKICDLKSKKWKLWKFLQRNQASNEVLSRQSLAQRCIDDTSLLRFIGSLVNDQFISIHPKIISFYTLTVIEIVDRMKAVQNKKGTSSEQILRCILPLLFKGMRSKDNQEYQMAVYMMITQLISVFPFSEELQQQVWKSIVHSSISSSSVHREAIICLVMMIQSQKQMFHSATFCNFYLAPLLSNAQFPAVLKQIGSKYDIHTFIMLILAQVCRPVDVAAQAEAGENLLRVIQTLLLSNDHIQFILEQHLLPFTVAQDEATNVEQQQQQVIAIVQALNAKYPLIVDVVLSQLYQKHPTVSFQFLYQCQSRFLPVDETCCFVALTHVHPEIRLLAIERLEKQLITEKKEGSNWKNEAEKDQVISMLLDRLQDDHAPVVLRMIQSAFPMSAFLAENISIDRLLPVITQCFEFWKTQPASDDVVFSALLQFLAKFSATNANDEEQIFELYLPFLIEHQNLQSVAWKGIQQLQSPLTFLSKVSNISDMAKQMKTGWKNYLPLFEKWTQTASPSFVLQLAFELHQIIPKKQNLEQLESMLIDLLIQEWSELTSPKHHSVTKRMKKKITWMSQCVCQLLVKNGSSSATPAVQLKMEALIEMYLSSPSELWKTYIQQDLIQYHCLDSSSIALKWIVPLLLSSSNGVLSRVRGLQLLALLPVGKDADTNTDALICLWWSFLQDSEKSIRQSAFQCLHKYSTATSTTKSGVFESYLQHKQELVMDSQYFFHGIQNDSSELLEWIVLQSFELNQQHPKSLHFIWQCLAQKNKLWGWNAQVIEWMELHWAKSATLAEFQEEMKWIIQSWMCPNPGTSSSDSFSSIFDLLCTILQSSDSSNSELIACIVQSFSSAWFSQLSWTNQNKWMDCFFTSSISFPFELCIGKFQSISISLQLWEQQFQRLLHLRSSDAAVVATPKRKTRKTRSSTAVTPASTNSAIDSSNHELTTCEIHAIEMFQLQLMKKNIQWSDHTESKPESDCYVLDYIYHFFHIITSSGASSELEYLIQVTLDAMKLFIQQFPARLHFQEQSSSSMTFQTKLLEQLQQSHGSLTLRNATFLVLYHYFQVFPAQLKLEYLVQVLTTLVNECHDTTFQLILQWVELLVPALLKTEDMVHVQTQLFQFYSHLSSKQQELYAIALIQALNPSQALAQVMLDCFTISANIVSKEAMVQIYVHFPTSIQIHGLMKLMEASSLDQEPEEEEETNTKMTTKSFSGAEKLALVSFVSTILTHHDENRMLMMLEKECQIDLLSCTQFIVESLEHAADTDNRAIQTQLLSVFHQIQFFLSTPSFMAVIEELFQHKNQWFHEQALHILHLRLVTSTTLAISDDVEDLQQPQRKVEEQKLYLDFITTWIQQTQDDDDKSRARPAANVISILMMIEILARAFGKSHSEAFQHLCASYIVPVFAETKYEHSSVSTFSALFLCLSSITQSLEALMFPLLPRLCPLIIQTLEWIQSQQASMSMSKSALANLSTCGFSCLEHMIEHMASFLSPYWNRILKLLITAQSSGTTQTQEPPLERMMTMILARVEIRQVLPALLSIYQDCCLTGATTTTNHPASLDVFFATLSQVIEKCSKSDMQHYLSALFKFFCSSLDLQLRESRAWKSTTTVTLLCCMNWVLKMNEKQLKPILLKFCEWMESTSKNSDSTSTTLKRKYIFYAFIQHLGSTLKSIFLPYFGYFWKDMIAFCAQGQAYVITHGQTAAVLQKEDDEEVDDFFTSEPVLKKQRLDTETTQETENLVMLYQDVLVQCWKSLSEWFQYETQLEEEKFQMILHPLVDQMDVLLTFETQEARSRASSVLTEACSVLAIATGKDLLWKSLHHQVLMKARDGTSVFIRSVALEMLRQWYTRMGEEYLVMLPESLPFLAELLEDTNVDVRTQCQAVIKTIETLSGESLDEYLCA